MKRVKETEADKTLKCMYCEPRSYIKNSCSNRLLEYHFYQAIPALKAHNSIPNVAYLGSGCSLCPPVTNPHLYDFHRHAGTTGHRLSFTFPSFLKPRYPFSFVL